MSSEELGQGLREIIDDAHQLAQRLGVDFNQTALALDEMFIGEEEAKRSGALAALQALMTTVGNLAHPRSRPTLEQCKQALETLKQRGTVLSAYEATYVQTLTIFCERIEDLIEKSIES